MNALTWIHIAGGVIALVAGAAAVSARKGGRLHASAGTWFAVSMLVLGATAAVLAQAQGDAGLGLGGLLTCYFVATSWVTARRRDGTTGKFEIAACALAFAAAAGIVWSGLAGESTTSSGAGPILALAAICVLAGLGDLKAIIARKLTPVQRLSRHLWRMCVAFFIATGSFFLGQQDVMPEGARGSPILFVLAFAPFAVMLFWLVRLRFAKAIARSKQSGLISIGRRAQTHV
ncbi:hypothetical protein [Allosphingosinicella sp.]|uniref:hypothetical protein n=1 Tax=Allosphingosinicella sp. TaxID=2823234 RepID=UPI002F1690E7